MSLDQKLKLAVPRRWLLAIAGLSWSNSGGILL